MTVTSVPERLGAADFQSSAVQLHERLGDRQAEAGALAPARAAGVDLAERRQRHRDLFLGHADAGVAHDDGRRRRPEAAVPRWSPSRRAA